MTRVHIKLQRVQTWLFAVPRLRAMVGANVLLGEVLRVRLPELARKGDGWSLAPFADVPKPTIDDDPLAEHDDPAKDAAGGILSRDGGHFEAEFASGAHAFAAAAASLLRRELPGLRFRIDIDGDPLESASTELSAELPVLAPCQWTGRGLASIHISPGGDGVDVSLDVHRRHEAARRAKDWQARDLVTLLAAKTKLRGMERPDTFEKLVGDGYLALVHADGNSVGAAAQGMEDDERSAFFHRNRVLLRRALKLAIDQVCGEAETAPLVPLMLGGDDLLLVCRAAVALPFVVALCRALAQIQDTEDRDFKLTLGVGVVITRPTVPIHRLHDVAERLAGSAKRRYRGLAPDKRCSVVDWAVYSTSRVDDPVETRRRDWLQGASGDLRVLSRRPLDVLGDDTSSLEGLVRAASRLEKAPRSQLRYLVDQLPRDRALSELAFEGLSPEARKALESAGISQVWSSAKKGEPRLTSVLDLVEVFEIDRLGRAGTSGRTGEGTMEKEAQHAQA